MSFQERLQQALDKAPAKEVYNGLSKPYTWDKEANQKRCVR